jgi:hypothetical protein
MTNLAAEEPLLAIYSLVFILVIGRSIRLARGVPFSTNRLWVQAGIYLFLFVITIVLDLTVLPVWIFGLDAGVLGVGAWLSSSYVRRITEFTVRPDGLWMYRLGILLPMIYLGLYAVRIVVELVVLPDPFGATGPLPTLAPLQQLALAAVDTLFALSAGLLVGRSVGVYQAYQERKRNLPPIPSSPPSARLGL